MTRPTRVTRRAIALRVVVTRGRPRAKPARQACAMAGLTEEIKAAAEKVRSIGSHTKKLHNAHHVCAPRAQMAEFKVRNGEAFESMIRDKQCDNPTFSFLFDLARSRITTARAATRLESTRTQTGGCLHRCDGQPGNPPHVV